MDLAGFTRAIAHEDGRLRNVTRIEIEIIGRRSLRWTLWDGSQRLVSLSAQPGDIPPMLRSSRAILRARTGLDPMAPDGDHETITTRKGIASNGR